MPCRADLACGYTLDVRGGWYDAGDHGKYVVNGGIAAWQLLNSYERAEQRSVTPTAFGDGTLAIPEKANGVPDLLDEARWEVEFLLKMQAPDGMAHHKIHDENWTGLPTRPELDDQPRRLSATSTAATLNLAAVAAQAARLWRGHRRRRSPRRCSRRRARRTRRPRRTRPSSPTRTTAPAAVRTATTR